MTAFGTTEHAENEYVLRVEVKTVNHRFFNAQLRTPAGFDAWEPELTRWLRESISRGHVNCTVSVDLASGPERGDLPQLDLERAGRYRDLLRTLKEELDLEGDVDIRTLSRFGDLFRAPDPLPVIETLDLAVVERTTRSVLEQVVHMREVEGARLQAALEASIEAMSGHLDEIEEVAPERLITERDRIREQIRELTEGTAVDEDRLARETAYLAEKWDIAEELVRFRSHIELFEETLGEPSGTPVGKRLGFVVQEMLREANTIGSKANNSRISRASVALKEEIERVREQLENVE